MDTNRTKRCLGEIPGLLGGALLMLAAASGVSAQQAPTPQNVVLFLTDDQRWDTLWAMPIVQQELVSKGVNFTNAYATTPLCCPFRASLLAGGFYPHQTGVLNNDWPNGGVLRFRDAETLATRVRLQGYRTALFGKYMNKYAEIAPWIPPGWSRFVADVDGGTVASGSSGERDPAFGQIVSGVAALSLRVPFHQDQALQFIDEAPNAPFLLILSLFPPHHPAIPEAADAGLYPGFVYRGRAHGEADLSDKPARVQELASDHSNFFSSQEEQDEFHRDQLRNLGSVDRAVAAIVDRLETRGLLDRTVLIFASDNGYMWGEHGLFKKGWAYEESARVPLVVVMPGVSPRQEDHLVAANLDLGATLLAITGADGPTDGRNLVPLLSDPQAEWREELPLQSWFRCWSGLRTRDGTGEWKYVEWCSGERELYDLAADPYEEESLHDDPAQAERLTELAGRLAATRGLGITTWTVDEGSVGVPYSFDLGAWGGQQPYLWRVVGGELPKGLVLQPGTGRVSGIPVARGTRQVLLRVDDSSIAAHTGRPQSDRVYLSFEVTLDGDDGDGIPFQQDICPHAYDPSQADADGDGIGDACDKACSNGLDDDGDGRFDGADPGCLGPADGSERSSDIVCDDGWDNDDDGRVDYPADPGCLSPSMSTEKGIKGFGCGLGFELAMILVGLGALHGRRSRGKLRRRSAASPSAS